MANKGLSKAFDARRVLCRFVREGRITRLPAKQSMRLVVLTWLAEKFLTDRTYSESEVNQILANHDVDHAYLRRSLVDFRLLNRNHGKYQRI